MIPDTEYELNDLIVERKELGWEESIRIDNYIVFYKDINDDKTICCTGE